MNYITNILTPLFITLGLVNPAPVVEEYVKPLPVAIEIVEVIPEPVVVLEKKEIVVTPKPVAKAVIEVKEVVIIEEPVVVESIIEEVELVIDNSKQEKFDKKFNFKKKEIKKKIGENKNTVFSSKEEGLIERYNYELEKTANEWSVEWEHLVY